jgi:hypothetical protein
VRRTHWLWAFTLVAVATGAQALAKEIQFDCNELGPGATQTYIETFPVRSRFAKQIDVTIDASNIGTEKEPKCHVKWTVKGTLAGRTRVLFTHSDDPRFSLNGASLDGTSPDGSKLLLDFFTAEGDFTGHRPVVYDFATGTWTIRDVSDRITRTLPHCDYLTMIQGVTNGGDVILYVPKGLSGKGCPDQGEWLLDMKNDAITRLERSN